MQIDFVYQNETDCQEDYQDIFYDIIAETLRQLNIGDDVELSAIIVDDERIQDINATYRGIDRATDVISFAMEDEEPIMVAGMPRELGDIFISYDHAVSQSHQYGHSLKREMAFLFTHGLLHLLGFDHMEPEDEKIMIARQKEILDALSIRREEDV